MTQRVPAFSFLGVPVFIPKSAGLGIALISWFFVPVAQNVLSPDTASWIVMGVALLHAVAIYVTIFAHEVGHTIAALHFGYKVDAIVIHVVGGHTTFAREFTRPRHQFVTALWGPLATAGIALLSWGVALGFENGIAYSVFAWLAVSSTVMSVINLLPGTPLDGGALLSAVVWIIRKDRIAGRIAAASGGILIATLWSISPYLMNVFFGWELDTYNVVVSFLVGMWLASAAWNSLWTARKSRTSPTPEALTPSDNSDLVLTETSIDEDQTVISILNVTRRALAVDENENVDAALRKSVDAKAGAIVVMRGENALGIVRDAAIAAVAVERRLTTKVSSTARRISDKDRIPLEITVRELRETLNHLGESEWLVVDEDNKIVGVALRNELQNQLQESRS